MVYIRYITVSAKIDEKLWKKIKELGIKPSKVIRDALEKEVERKIIEKLYKDIEKISEIILEVGKENWIKAVRESRDER